MVATRTNDRETLRAGGRLLGGILQEVARAVRPGIMIAELDMLAEQLIRDAGGHPAFKGYLPAHATRAFPGTLCVSINSEVVHGVPTRSVALVEGDVVGLDIGMRWPARGGLYTDTAVTVGVGVIPPDAQRLIDVTRAALDRGIEAAVVGSRISHIAKAVQHFVEAAGFSIVRDLVGHGVGAAIHEAPQVPNFWNRTFLDEELLDGFVIAIEPMVAAGSWQVGLLADTWTVITSDGSLAAHFEHTVLITKDGTEILTSGVRSASSAM